MLNYILDWIKSTSEKKNLVSDTACLREEIRELIEELDKVDFATNPNTAKELIDVMWVCGVLLDTLGYDPRRLAFAVYVNNMAKTFTKKEDAEAFCPKGGIVTQVGNRFCIKNQSGKIIKPLNFEKLTMREVEGCKYART